MYLELLLTFAKIGVMTFGGGYAMLPIIQREIVENKKWVTEEEVINYYAIGQCTPGVIAVNTATFIGYKLKGIPGSIFATLGVVLPSFIIISILAGIISQVADLTMVQHAFAGIRVAVCALVVHVIIRMAKTSIVDLPTIIIAGLAFILVNFLSVSPIFIVVGAALSGIVIKRLRGVY